jgi:G:T/U-mismatch repair DNA glycosylase
MNTYYHNNEKYIFDHHKFESEIPEGAKWLIVGTFPTLQRNIEYDFYYSSKSNIFWRLVAEIFEYQFEYHKTELAASERKSFIRMNKIGMTDMIEACYRKQHSSQDQGIIPIKLRDVFSILDAHSTIDTVILTSRSGIISAEGLFKSLFLSEHKTLTLMKTDSGISIGEFQRGRKIKVLVPYSTSRSFHKDDPKIYQQIKKMYASCFDKQCD